jgi:hypothetical protein
MSHRLRATPTTVPAPPSTTAAPGESLCGYWLVRKLGDGLRAEVFLGFAESSLGGDGAPATAALKVCRHGTGGSATTELEALARAEHPHVVRLVDAATTPSGVPCLVLERLARGSLAHLLERRERLNAGEAITILAPIATAVEVLHASGVVHGTIGAGAVLFRESGAPVLARFGRATLIEAGLASALLAPLVAADRADLAELSALVLDRVGSRAATELGHWARANAASDAFESVLADRLFSLGEATPVLFDATTPVASAVPARVATGAAAHRQRVTGIARLQTLVPVEIAGHAIDAVRSLRVVRTSVWVAAASVLVALVAAVLVIPAGTDGTQARANTLATPASRAASVPATTEPTAVASGESSTPAPPEDPTIALTALLSTRDRCLDELSVLCLDAVDQSGASALDDDADLIRGVRTGGEVPATSRIGASAPRLVERLGDSALVDLVGNGKPASVLMIRTEAGWRIRDYLG